MARLMHSLRSILRNEIFSVVRDSQSFNLTSTQIAAIYHPLYFQSHSTRATGHWATHIRADSYPFPLFVPVPVWVKPVSTIITGEDCDTISVCKKLKLKSSHLHSESFRTNWDKSVEKNEWSVWQTLNLAVLGLSPIWLLAGFVQHPTHTFK